MFLNQPSGFQADHPIDWLATLTDWMTDWLTDLLTDWLTDWLTDRLLN